MSKYHGGWSTNNGNTWSGGYTSNSKAKLAKDLREMAKGNLTGRTDKGSFTIYETIEDGVGEYGQPLTRDVPVMHGTVRF